MKFIFFIIITIIISNTSYAKDWTYLTKNKSGIDFFVDYNSLEKNGNNILFWYLSNRKTPDKWGSLSNAVLREADCKNMRFKSLRYAYYYGNMGTNLEKYANSTNMKWMYPKFGSVNEVMLNSICKKSAFLNKGKPKKSNKTSIIKVANQANILKSQASNCYQSIPKIYQGSLARMFLNANKMFKRGLDMIKTGNNNLAINAFKNATNQYQAFMNAGNNVGGKSCSSSL